MTKEFRASVKRLHLLTVHFQTVVAPRKLLFFFFLAFFKIFFNWDFLPTSAESCWRRAGWLVGYFGERIILGRFYKETSLM